MTKIDWVRSHSQIPSDLWQECFPPPFEGHWWYEVLEESGLEDQFRFYYGIIFVDGNAIGIVPAFLNDVPIELVAPEEIASGLRFLSKFIPSIGYQRTFFIGSPCADEGTIGLLPGLSLLDFAQIIHQEIITLATKLKAPMIVWKDFPQSDTAALNTLCKDGKVFKMVSYPGTALFLPEANMEVYYKGLKGSYRHKLKKKLRLSKEEFPFEVSIIQNPDKENLAEIFSLFWQTYENGKTKFERLNEKFFSLIAAQKQSYFVLLRQPNQGRLVAFMLCFHLGEKMINKFIGLDYAIARQANLYFRLWEAALSWTVSCGVKEFQSGQTGYRFKIETGNTLMPLYNYCQNTNTLVNIIYAQVAKTISWASLDKDLETYVKAHPDSVAD